jgi:uncharacterized protein YdeI (BOF family)
MNRIFSTALILLVLLFAVLGFANPNASNHFGAAFTKAKLVTLAELTTKADQYHGKTVKIKGTIKDVCQREGCWLVLTDGTREMRVSMKDHKFTVPKDSGNKTVIVEGVIEKQSISEEMARHYAEESAGKVDPNSIKGQQIVLSMTATGVRING